MAFLEQRAAQAGMEEGRLRSDPLAEPITRKYRSWMRMGDDEVVAIVNTFVKENGVENRTQLWKADAGMADRIKKRGLWDRIEFGRKNGAGNGQGGGAGSIAPAAGPAGFSRDDIVFLAQSAIDEMEVASLDELGRLDAEMHALVVETGAAGSLSFARPAGEAAGGTDGMRPYEGRRLMDEEAMYRLILSEGFGMGCANAALGSHRETIQKLQCGLKRKLKGPAQQRLFKRCWGRMEAEGAIAYNSNRTAASLDPSVRKPSDPALATALSWAFSEQAKVGP